MSAITDFEPAILDNRNRLGGRPAPVHPLLAVPSDLQGNAPSRGPASVKLDFLIGMKWASNARREKQRGLKPEILSADEAKSLRNKYFILKSLFPKDLAGIHR